VDGLRQNIEEALRYIESLEDEERKKGDELERVGEYVRKLERLIEDQKVALAAAAAKQQDLPPTHPSSKETRILRTFKASVKSEGLYDTLKQSLAYATRKIKRS